MLKKVSKVGGSKPTQTKTITKKSSGSSKQTQVKTTTKSSGSSKVSNTNTVKQTTPAPKPKNVDKVEFGKPKPTVDTGVYHKPKLIAAARGRDPEPSKQKKVEKAPEQAPKDLKYNGQYSETFKKEGVPLRSSAEQQHNRKIESEAHKQIEAEKKVEANKNKINVGPEMLIETVGIMTGSKPIQIAGVALHHYNDTRHDAGEYTLAEKVAYDNYLYPKHHGYMSLNDLERKNFAKEHKEEIDQVKTEIKKEEEGHG